MSPMARNNNNDHHHQEEDDDGSPRSFLSSRRSASERNLALLQKSELDRSQDSQKPSLDSGTRASPMSPRSLDNGGRPMLQTSQRSYSERDLGSRRKGDGNSLASENNNSNDHHSDEWDSFGSFHLPLRTMAEQDLFEQKLLNDLSSGHHRGTSGVDDDSTTSEGEDDDDGDDDNSSSGSFDSFAAHPEDARKQQNSEENKLFNFFERNNPGPDECYSDDEDDDGGSIFSMSIMSLNTTPFCIQEEEEGEEVAPPALSRMRSKFAVMTTEEAFDALVVEYSKLMDDVEVAEVMLDQRKMEKNQLSGLVMSREEEFVIRRDCIDKLQGTLETLEEEVMTEREKTQQMTKANKWTSRQKDAWEKLDTAVTKLDELRDENKKMITKLQERPEIADEEVTAQLRLNRRRKKVKSLEQEHEMLSKEVNLLRGKKKAKSQPPLIGLEIMVDENEDVASLTSTELLNR